MPRKGPVSRSLVERLSAARFSEAVCEDVSDYFVTVFSLLDIPVLSFGNDYGMDRDTLIPIPEEILEQLRGREYQHFFPVVFQGTDYLIVSTGGNVDPGGIFIPGIENEVLYLDLVEAKYVCLDR